MVAAHTLSRGKRRIVCTVIRIPNETPNESNRAAQRFAARPSDLVPWADPYIASLVRQLQSEVRQERVSSGPTLRPLLPGDATMQNVSPDCELDPPTPAFDIEPASSDWNDRNAPQWPTGDRFAKGQN